MTIADFASGTTQQVSDSGVADRLANSGISLRIGPFVGHLIIRLHRLIPIFCELYRHYPLLPAPQLHSFHVCMEPVRHLRRIHQPLVRFSIDGRAAHEDMPRSHALAVLEWGINLAVAFRSHNFLMLHSAVLEKNGVCLIMPAAPGDGKTTLCAALSMSGWRLFSDEFGLVVPGTAEFVPAPRPMALKNQSIEVIKGFAPDAFIGPSIEGTRKGTVAHMRPSKDSICRAGDRSTAGLVVFPKWKKNAALNVSSLSKADAFMQLASNAFNYELLGEDGFNAVASIIDGSRCFRLEYSDLEKAITTINDLAAATNG